MWLSREFFGYIEVGGDGGWIDSIYGPSLLLLILSTKLPKQLYDLHFHCHSTTFMERLSNAQKQLLYSKLLKVSKATNKTVSEGKFTNVVNEDTGRLKVLFD